MERMLRNIVRNLNKRGFKLDRARLGRGKYPRLRGLLEVHRSARTKDPRPALDLAHSSAGSGRAQSNARNFSILAGCGARPEP